MRSPLPVQLRTTPGRLATDYTGVAIGTYVAIERVGTDPNQSPLWFFRCPCGATKTWAAHWVSRVLRGIEAPPKRHECSQASDTNPAPITGDRETALADDASQIRNSVVEMKPASDSETGSGKRNKPKGKDRTGLKLGTFVAVERVGVDNYGAALWFFRCEVCGATHTWSSSSINRYATGSKSVPRHNCKPPARAAAPQATTVAPAPPKPRSEAPGRSDAPIRAPAPTPSNEVAKPAPAKVPPAIDPGLLGESIRSLVRTTAARIAVQHGAERHELMRVGMQAAERAANQWNSASGQPLITFANRLIREAMVEHARKAADSGDEDALLAQSMDAERGDDPNRKGWHTATHRLPPGSENDEAEDAEEDEESVAE